ncbi:hypothetical protein D3C83_67150 [compost metagenome]
MSRFVLHGLVEDGANGRIGGERERVECLERCHGFPDATLHDRLPCDRGEIRFDCQWSIER